MSTSFQTCLLIDDNPLDNYINTKLIQNVNFANEVLAFESPVDALFALKEGNIKPDVIFLDINMPVMNGFEFLMEYASLNITKDNIKLCVLSSSINPEDEDRALRSPYVTKYIQKNLKEEKLQELLNS